MSNLRVGVCFSNSQLTYSSDLPWRIGTQNYADTIEIAVVDPNIKLTLDFKSAYGALRRYGIKKVTANLGIE